MGNVWSWRFLPTILLFQHPPTVSSTARFSFISTTNEDLGQLHSMGWSARMLSRENSLITELFWLPQNTISNTAMCILMFTTASIGMSASIQDTKTSKKLKVSGVYEALKIDDYLYFLAGHTTPLHIPGHSHKLCRQIWMKTKHDTEKNLGYRLF